MSESDGVNSAGTLPGPHTTAPAALMDVWSRSGSKYRIRAILMLSVNALLFAGVGVFAFWLRSGLLFAPAIEGYWDQLARTFYFGSGNSVSLGTLLMEPISVRHVGMQIWVLGLLMATLISIPILVSILYRFWASLPFIAIVGFLAVMPWLAITLLGSCVIASVRPFQSRFRFMSALFGLVPAVVYLFLAWGGSRDVLVGDSDPADAIKFVAPWVLAVVAAAMVFAIVLLIARLVNYRTGAVTPLLAIMFALPVWLFEFHVGRDELYYRLLESFDRAQFTDLDASLDFQQAVDAAWARQQIRGHSRRALEDLIEQQWQFALGTDVGPFRSALVRQQAEVVDRCDWFQKYFPGSGHLPKVLYIKARALDMRVDPAEFRRTKWIRFYDNFPSNASLMSWTLLVENVPDTPLAAMGLLRVAQLEARDGDVERATGRLNELINRFGGAMTASWPERSFAAPVSSALADLLASDRPQDAPRVPMERILLDAHRLRDLLANNRDPIHGYEPLCGSTRRKAAIQFGLLDLDPRDDHYAANLQRLKAAYSNAQLEDNLDLEIARRAESPAQSIALLEQLLKRFPKQDAAPEALYRLAVAYKRAGRVPQSDEAFARLTAEFPGSFWTDQALRHNPRLPRVVVTHAGAP